MQTDEVFRQEIKTNPLSTLQQKDMPAVYAVTLLESYDHPLLRDPNFNPRNEDELKAALLSSDNNFSSINANIVTRITTFSANCTQLISCNCPGTGLICDMLSPTPHISTDSNEARLPTINNENDVSNEPKIPKITINNKNDGSDEPKNPDITTSSGNDLESEVGL